jgi:hypothetical protein
MSTGQLLYEALDLSPRSQRSVDFAEQELRNWELLINSCGTAEAVAAELRMTEQGGRGMRAETVLQQRLIFESRQDERAIILGPGGRLVTDWAVLTTVYIERGGLIHFPLATRQILFDHAMHHPHPDWQPFVERTIAAYNEKVAAEVAAHVAANPVGCLSVPAIAHGAAVPAPVLAPAIAPAVGEHAASEGLASSALPR